MCACASQLLALGFDVFPTRCSIWSLLVNKIRNWWLNHPLIWSWYSISCSFFYHFFYLRMNQWWSLSVGMVCSLGSIVREVQFVESFVALCLCCLKNRSTKLWCNLEVVFYSQSCRFSGHEPVFCSASEEGCRGRDWETKRRHPKFIANREKRHCVTLVIEDQLGTTFATSKQVWSEM